MMLRDDSGDIKTQTKMKTILIAPMAYHGIEDSASQFFGHRWPPIRHYYLKLVLSDLERDDYGRPGAMKINRIVNYLVQELFYPKV